MTTFRTGVCERVLTARAGLQRLQVRVGAELRTAVLYPRYAQPAVPGDRLILNTTATTLGLGSGGAEFVVWNLSAGSYDAPSGGHIMKLRYTPSQADVTVVEAPESPHHDIMRQASQLDGMPVVAASVHSQLLPVVAALHAAAPDARVVYVMTDGAALEAALSDTAWTLRELGWLAGTVTVGHALGGDLEAVNLYSGLLAARHVLAADAAVVCMGPGVVGTSTPLGTTAIELGLTVNAAAALGGRCVACVRMSSGDQRDRHAGVSEHTVVALTRVAIAAADVAAPKGYRSALDELTVRHRVVEVESEPVLGELRAAKAAGLSASHMGRGPDADPVFFLAAGAAGYHAASLLQPSAAG